jgi:hypothetical protein
MRNILLPLLLSVVAQPLPGQGAPTHGSADQPYAVEYYFQ